MKFFKAQGDSDSMWVWMPGYELRVKEVFRKVLAIQESTREVGNRKGKDIPRKGEGAIETSIKREKESEEKQ